MVICSAQFSLGVKQTVVFGQETQPDKSEQVNRTNKYEKIHPFS
ncbi:hypothetical protein wVul_0679 [Wolbachia endosymbiont of Armadillidium vulgare str. wVulC]|nr:hypothetical protein wVul_0679 [Wolbachia endosymbiont of Armadillidium vulgare str. wVulC]